MSLMVRLLQFYTPGWVKRRALDQLLSFTAAAFQCQPAATRGLTVDERLCHYARFTLEQVEQYRQRGGDPAVLHERLYWSAYQLGHIHGRLFRVCSTQEIMALARTLYRILEIDFSGDAQGEVIIRRCYFSRLYSAPVCSIMSGMDRGLLAGLSGGGQLIFSTRITEGAPCCRARFVLEQI